MESLASSKTEKVQYINGENRINHSKSKCDAKLGKGEGESGDAFKF